MNVTHLECSLTGERYEAGKIHNLSKAGKPLLVRYDLESSEADADTGQYRRARARHVEVARIAPARWRGGQPRRARDADRRGFQMLRRARAHRTCW